MKISKIIETSKGISIGSASDSDSVSSSGVSRSSNKYKDVSSDNFENILKLPVYDIDASFASVCNRAFPLMGCPSSAVRSVDADSFTCSCGNFTLLGAAVSTLVMQQAMARAQIPLASLVRK